MEPTRRLVLLSSNLIEAREWQDNVRVARSNRVQVGYVCETTFYHAENLQKAFLR